MRLDVLVVTLWEILVRLGGPGTLAIYGFDGGPWPHRLAGRLMMSRWWPEEAVLKEMEAE